MLGFIFRGAQGHGPVHIFLIFAAEFTFAWDGDEHGLVSGFPPSVAYDDWPFWKPGAFLFLLDFLNGKFLGVLNLLIFKNLYNCSPCPAWMKMR